MAIKAKVDKAVTATIKTDFDSPEAAAVPVLYARDLPEQRPADVASPYQSRQTYPGA